MLLAALLAVACGGGTPHVPDGPPLPFDRTGAPPPLQLDHLPATLALGGGNLPAGASQPETFTLPPVSPQPLNDGTDRVAWSWDLPFALKPGQERFLPPGMAVALGGEPLDYDISPYAPSRSGWRIKDGQLHVVLGEDRGAQGATIQHPALGAQIRRLEPALAGLEPDAFAHFTWTRELETRPGLLLPAPSSASWQVILPKGAHFRAWPDLVDVPVAQAASDGATVALVVEARGKREEVAAGLVVPGGVEDGLAARLSGPSPSWDVDLSRWSGEEVTLRLETRVRGTADYDWVFLGTPVVWGTPTAPVRRVVVIGLDTTRPDHLGAHGYERNTSPELDALAAQSAVFDDAVAPAPRTRPSFRSSTTGRGVHDAVGAKNVGEVFREAGFATAGFAANVHLNPRFGFDDGFDVWLLDSAAKAEHQVDRSIAWLEQHRDRDTYLFVHLMDPHLFYDAPGEWRDRFVTEAPTTLPPWFNRWQIYEWEAAGYVGEAEKQWLVDLYDGEIAYMSHEIGRLLAALDDLGGNTLVVLHTDHGEEFWEHGGYEHNHSLYGEVMHAALWVKPPQGAPGVRIDEPVTLSDIAPTLYDYAGLTDVPQSDGRSLRPLVEGRDPGAWDRALPLGHLMYDVEQWGVMWRGHKYVLETTSGTERLFDLATDPGEHVDLSAERDLAPYRRALAEAHAMPVGPGWRLDIDLDGSAPLVWDLPAPAVEVAVIDPEAASHNRVNRVWGEKPKILAEEVAEIALSADRRRLTIVPGRRGNGTLRVRFDREVAAGGVLRRGEEPLALVIDASGTAWAHGDGTRVLLRPGTVLQPPPSEYERMFAARGAVEADATDVELLRALGYVGGGE